MVEVAGGILVAFAVIVGGLLILPFLGGILRGVGSGLAFLFLLLPIAAGAT